MIDYRHQYKYDGPMTDLTTGPIHPDITEMHVTAKCIYRSSVIEELRKAKMLRFVTAWQEDRHLFNSDFRIWGKANDLLSILDDLHVTGAILVPHGPKRDWRKKSEFRL